MRILFMPYLLLLLCSDVYGQQGEFRQAILTPDQYLSSTEPSTEIYLISINKGDKVIVPLDIFYQSKITRPVLANIVKTAGIILATYQTGKIITSGKGTSLSSKSNILVPIGLGIALASNKITSRKRKPIYLKYQFYDLDMSLLKTEVVKINRKPPKKVEEMDFSFETPQKGFLEITVFNMPGELRKDLIVNISENPENTSESIGEIELFEPAHRSARINITEEIVYSNTPQVNLPVLPEFRQNINLDEKFIGSNLSKKDKVRLKLDLPVTKKIEIPRVIENTFGENISIVSIPANTNDKEQKIPPIIPPFLIANRYQFKGRKRLRSNDNDESIYESEEPNDESPEYKAPHISIELNHVPGVNGVGYGTGGDTTVYSTPHGTSYGSPWGGWGGWGGDRSPSQSSSMGWSNYDEPTWVDPCDPYMPESECYSPCPPDVTSRGLRVDPGAFKQILDERLPKGYVNPIARISVEESNGMIQYKMSGAYSDAAGNFTTFTSFNIGNAIPNYGARSMQLMTQQGMGPTGDVFNFADCTVQNYRNDATGNIYALVTDLNNNVWCFPDVTVLGFPMSGAAVSLGVLPLIFADPSNSLDTLMHEYGHRLQLQIFGDDYFTGMALTSLWSATVNPANHEKIWTETSANALAMQYFGPLANLWGSVEHKSTICDE